MPLAGIYRIDGDPHEEEFEELTYRRVAVFDTDRGVWLEGSDGMFTMDFADEDLVDADIEEVLDMFWDRYVGTRGLYIKQESEVPGEIVEEESLHEPESELVEGADDTQ